MLNRKFIWALIGLLVLLAWATPTFALPPRPIPPPENTPLPPARTLGGWIELRAQNAKSQWTVVQWQDSAGNWVSVESWRGAFDSIGDGTGKKTWWVDQSSFSATPFRWMVYEPTTNQVIATSQPFNLPAENKQTVTTLITLAP